MPSGGYHYVYTISEEPSCYFYIYLNETAIILSDYFDNFNTNMMRIYNEKLGNLTNENEQSEDLIWKAYNLTLIENSKNFLHMITYNESDPNQDVNKDMGETINLFKARKLNNTIIYNTFVNQFYETFYNNNFKQKIGFFEKYYKKLISNLLRYKQR